MQQDARHPTSDGSLSDSCALAHRASSKQAKISFSITVSPHALVCGVMGTYLIIDTQHPSQGAGSSLILLVSMLP